MSGHGQKLRRKEETAISALLTQGTLAEAAQVAGIGEATLRRWLQRDDFQAAYRRARREAVSQAVAHLQKASGAAVDTLRGIMQDPHKLASARVTAARVILEIAIKAVELENLEVRLAVLEARLTAERPEGNTHVPA
jgi:FAD/FMN-containing dehydrogenase